MQSMDEVRSDILQSILIRELPQWLDLASLMLAGRANQQWHIISRDHLRRRNIPDDVAFYNYEIAQLHSQNIDGLGITNLPLSGRWPLHCAPELMPRVLNADVTLWSAWLRNGFIKWARYIPLSREFFIRPGLNMSRDFSGYVDKKFTDSKDKIPGSILENAYHLATFYLWTDFRWRFKEIINRMDEIQLSLLVDIMSVSGMFPRWSFHIIRDTAGKFYVPATRDPQIYDKCLSDRPSSSMATYRQWNRFVKNVTVRWPRP